MDEPKIVETLLPAVKYAGQEIRKIYQLKPTRLIKNDGSPVTIADKETEKICKEVIKSLGATSIIDMGKIMGSL